MTNLLKKCKIYAGNFRQRQKMKEITIIVPSYNPDEKLLEVVKGLVEGGFEDILVVNDGSKEECLEHFKEVDQFDQVTVITHEVNKGKGRAMKTAFSYVLENRPNSIGVITVDGDNQHTVKDIRYMAERMMEDPHSVFIGCRDFNDPKVPGRSRFGNKITSFIFTYVLRIPIRDTQTGLRGTPREYLPAMLETRGERYEFETEMFFTLKEKNIPFKETTIETVYIEENQTSHFHPFRDSWKIYKLIFRFMFKQLFRFFKFMISSLLAFLTDFGVYSLMLLLLDGKMDERYVLAIAVVAGKVLSSILNFTLNRKVVFKSKDGMGGTLLRYYILWICQTACSYGLITLFTMCFGADNLIFKILIKPVVDIFLFLLSYRIQRDWVFKSGKKKNLK